MRKKDNELKEVINRLENLLEEAKKTAENFHTLAIRMILGGNNE